MTGSLSPTGTSTAYVPARVVATRNAAIGVGARTGSTAENASREKRTESQLSEADQQKVNALKQTDRRVRAHEMAHVAAGGSLVKSGANFNYETGPDGQRYAVGGEVAIDASPGRSPEETIDKATRIKAAALAPADPSPQDRQVAALAARMALQASIERTIQQKNSGEAQNAGDRKPDNATANHLHNRYSGPAVAGEAAASGTAIDLFA